ncbi:MAG: type I 3-dehydroquinate dehydratase [Firmicutes bacterium]|nr:type I 3-dehydroquinate dehydratase [Bacillota bacterium]MDY5531965.1 type I 3-dehydroquinate dehydratase [Pumilibacteraceae bacterium]
MKASFIRSDKPLKTAMIQVKNADEAIAAIESGLKQGADAFGWQLECLSDDQINEKTLKNVFSAGFGKPFYVTNYKWASGGDKPEEQYFDELLLALKCGATLIDMPGDSFSPAPDQLTYDEQAISKQIVFAQKVHDLGGELLISSHVPDYRSEDYVLGMAFEQKRRGADVAKIVTFSHDDEQLTDNLKTTVRLRETLGIPFLFLSGGEKCRLHRLAGPLLGACMWLCVAYRAPITTPPQPLLSDVNEFLRIYESKE